VKNGQRLQDVDDSFVLAKLRVPGNRPLAYAGPPTLMSSRDLRPYRLAANTGRDRSFLEKDRRHKGFEKVWTACCFPRYG